MTPCLPDVTPVAEQVGRTAELARTFGIDFFAVLFRGSQYRVESMMARLAHTQNYLLPSPSKEQVGAPGCGAGLLAAPHDAFFFLVM